MRFPFWHNNWASLRCCHVEEMVLEKNQSGDCKKRDSKRFSLLICHFLDSPDSHVGICSPWASSPKSPFLIGIWPTICINPLEIFHPGLHGVASLLLGQVILYQWGWMKYGTRNVKETSRFVGVGEKVWKVEMGLAWGGVGFHYPTKKKLTIY